MEQKKIKKVLITGGNGMLAKKLIEGLSGHPSYKCEFVLVDIKFSSERREKKYGQYVLGNFLIWNEDWVQSFKGVDVVFHLALNFGVFHKGTWNDGIQSMDINNNVFLAAIKHGVHRIVFASSNHVMGGYFSKRLGKGQLLTSLPPIGATKFVLSDLTMDTTIYGFTKLVAERLGKNLVESGRLKSFIAIRIGWCQEGENHPRTLKPHGNPPTHPVVVENEDALRQEIIKWFQRMWLSNGDYVRLVNACVKTEHEGFVIINGVSKNTDSVWDISGGKCIGYEPQDDVIQGLVSRL